MDKAAQAYCQTQAAHWRNVAHTRWAGTGPRRVAALMEARAWLKASKAYRLGHPAAPWQATGYILSKMR